MKTLVLVRHAKSSWKDPSLADLERPLNKRGKGDAPLMAERFAARDIDVDLVVCSPAERARRTAKIFCGEMGYQWDLVAIDERIYDADAGELLQFIRQTDDQIDTLMLFGHNPGFTDLANQFSPVVIDNVPTTGVVTMTFDTSRWKRVHELEPVDLDFDSPKKARRV